MAHTPHIITQDDRVCFLTAHLLVLKPLEANPPPPPFWGTCEMAPFLRLCLSSFTAQDGLPLLPALVLHHSLPIVPEWTVPAPTEIIPHLLTSLMATLL